MKRKDLLLLLTVLLSQLTPVWAMDPSDNDDSDKDLRNNTSLCTYHQRINIVDTELRVLRIEEKAEKGNPHVQQYLGKLLEKGKVTPRNMSKAFEVYQKAAKQGKRSAQRRLADRAQALEASKNKSTKSSTIK